MLFCGRNGVRCQTRGGSRQNSIMLQAKQPVKALLPHCQSYEKSQLRELLFIEMFIKRFP
jgi:hypothetical protein